MPRSKRVRALVLAAGLALLTTSGSAQMQPLDSGSLIAAVDKLQPGQFLWVPEIAPAGPMLVMVNIQTQQLIAYRNGVPIAASTVSTGRPGHRTPTGVFTVLQKQVFHRSSKYSNAPMPFMQRLTWFGIAMHGGTLPGYPASHGCIRLPHQFAKLLFGETSLGMTVVVVNRPEPLAVGPTAQTLVSGQRSAGIGPAVWQPQLSPSGPVSIVVSAADRRMVVLRNGVQIGSAPVSFDGVVDHVQAYVLQSVDGSQYRWGRVTLPGQDAPSVERPGDDGGRFQGTDPFRRALATVVGPGTTMVVLPDSFGPGGGVPREQVAMLDESSVVAGWLTDARVSGAR